jgi:glycosyltransferase involved in cell wall biosynthesis
MAVFICFFALTKAYQILNPKNLLIVSYYFPPFHRVGGRRWAKFAKYLFRSGWDIHVVAGDFPDSVSPWDKDTELYSDRIHRVIVTTLPIPYFKHTLPQNLVQKMRWKLSQWIYESFTKKNYVGDYTDPSYMDGPAFAATAGKVLINNPKIRNVIISVGPYNYAIDVLRLKKEFPNVRFWLDYRDVWITWEGLTNKQKQALALYQIELNRLSDAFLTVHEMIGNELMSKYKKPTFVVPHAFDNDDFNGLEELKPKTDKIQFVYGGDLYAGFETRVAQLSKLLELLNKCGYNSQAIIYADKRKHPHQKWNNVHFREALMLNDFFRAIKSSDFSLIIRGSKPLHLFTTKFYELIRLEKPILVIDDASPEMEFIESKKLGLGLTNETDLDSLAKAVINQKLKNELPKPYDLQNHTIDYTGALLCELLLKEI